MFLNFSIFNVKFYQIYIRCTKRERERERERERKRERERERKRERDLIVTKKNNDYTFCKI